ncbi:MAG: hypothetical protein SWJ54_06890 [Cyanobacteriota bacterium]|nr:hypothetical protein [Cyanobacteriota bacterium]
MIQTNRILKYFVIVLSLSLLHHILATKGLAHAPEFHLPEETPSESTENPEAQNRDNSVDNLQIEVQETEVNVQPASDVDDDTVNDSTQNNLNTVWGEALIIWILINPFLLYYLKARFSIKNTSKTSLLQ